MIENILNITNIEIVNKKHGEICIHFRLAQTNIFDFVNSLKNSLESKNRAAMDSGTVMHGELYLTSHVPNITSIQHLFISSIVRLVGIEFRDEIVLVKTET